MLKMMMTSFAIEGAMASMVHIQKLMITYKKRGIDAIPIKELEDVIDKSMRDSLSENSLTNRIMESMMKGELNGEK